MNDLIVYVIIGALILYLLYTVMKKQAPPIGHPDSRDYRVRGDERPRYDHPDVRGDGSFGRDADVDVYEVNRDREIDRDRHKDDVVPVWMKRERDRNDRQPPRRVSSQSANDNPDIQGHGGFGRDKD